MQRDGSQSRRKWSAEESVLKEQDEGMTGDVPEAYEEYLIMLQERNRVAKKMKKKDDAQIQLEKKEQGFSLYVNGANTDLLERRKKHELNSKQPKTASGRAKGNLLVPEKSQKKPRSKTAPEKSRRKTWVAGSVNLKTHRGDKLHIKAPEILTGRYEDDFEELEESLQQDSDSTISTQSSSSDSDSSEDANPRNQRRRRPRKKKGKNLDSTLTLSVADVKKLRTSLEMNASIRESLALAIDTSESEPEREADIPEEEEDLQTGRSSKSRPVSRIKPTDVIVLEFDAPKAKDSKKTHSLAAARKEPSSSSMLHQPKSLRDKKTVHRTPREILSKPESPAQRKQRPSPRQSHDSSENVKAVAEAMRSENSNVEKVKRGSQSAPGRHENDNGSPMPTPKTRPVSSAAAKNWKQKLEATPHTAYSSTPQSPYEKSVMPPQSIRKSKTNQSQDSKVTSSTQKVVNPSQTTENVGDIVQKVLQLDVNAQKKLFKALSEIEQGAGFSIDELLTTAEVQQPKKLSPRPVTKVQGPDSQGSKCNVVRIQILSNWGDSSRVGLTELQLFDEARKRINVDASKVQHGQVSNASNNVSVLFNGKCKTVKERNMWTCDIDRSGQGIGLSIPLPDDAELSRLKIWNYNKSLSDLGIGVRRIRISYHDTVIFNGEIDKGCGNQVFDYGKEIVIDPSLKSLKKSSEHSKHLEVSHTPAMDNVSLHSDSEDARSPAVSSEFPRTELKRPGTRVLPRPQNQDLQRPVITPADTNDDLHASNSSIGRKKKIRKSKMAAKLDGSEDQTKDSNLADSSSTEGSDGQVPSWLKETDTAPFPNPPLSSRSENRDDDSILENWSRNGTSHLKTDLDSYPAVKSPMSGRRAKELKTPDRVADENEEVKFREAMVEEALTSEDRPSRMKKIESQRSQWRQREQSKLEESWSSLSLFERSHQGRLSLDMENDVMDEYLNTHRQQEETILEEDGDSDDDFIIPELPKGKELTINILTSWGDNHYIGLNGIEVHTETGEQAPVAKVWADPPDINILPGYSKDPRVAANLIDGVNRTRDDTHMWLAPFTRGKDHQIFLSFEKPVCIAMMRIWNYNKSRIHSFRGVKDIEVKLDGRLIFRGEIARACGGIMGGSEAFGDTILFTTDEDILELVSQYDKTFEADIYAEDEGEEDCERPKTADDGNQQPDARPFTSVARGNHAAPPSNGKNVDVHVEDDGTAVFRGQVLELNFTETWGDMYYLGLTGMEVVGADGEALDVTLQLLEADPRDLHVLPGYESDDRTLDKLIDGVNITTSDEHMWLIPYTEGESHTLKINFNQPQLMCGLRFWNYNKSAEDTYRGARTVHVSLDGHCLSPRGGFLIRKGPGNCFFDFAQEVTFINPADTSKVIQKQAHTAPKIKTSASLILDEPSQEYETVQKPCGFIYQFHLLSTWGDPYYVGLNGLEFYDAEGNLIPLTENNISAYPDSVNVLDGVDNDTRTPDKLINGVNDSEDGSNFWLAPVLPSILNRVYVIFDHPMEVSMIKLWNYSKTNNRGVKDFALLVDDLLVYNGVLGRVSSGARGILPTMSAPQEYHTILFTDDKEIRQKEKHTIIMNQTGEQDVQLLNDREVVTKFSDPKMAHSGKPVDQALRPTTSMPERGMKKRK